MNMTGGTNCQKRNFFVVILLTMTSKESDRTYLRQEERTALQLLLQDWANQPDKKSKDAFVSGTALPRIQQLNATEFGPDMISTNKVAKVNWEKRVSVSETL